MKAIPIRKITTAEEDQISEGFRIRNIRDMLSGKDMVQELHRHNFFYVLVIEKGSGNHEIDFTAYKIADHTVFFLRPGQVHQLKLNARSTGYMMAFNTEFYYLQDKKSTHVLRKVSNKNHYQLDSNRFEKLVTILTYIFKEFTEKQESYLDAIKASLHIFLIELLRQKHHGLDEPNSITAYQQERLDDFLSQLVIHISTHKQVSDYADMLNLSTYQLNAITKSSIGKTCSAVINEYIILESKRYLLATAYQVNQIAYYLGYEDVSYFIRFFKKQTGYTPEAFRHNFK
jgi:AraC family transcriptional regulator, transcriptional activator of pobA